jgi:hypothetical protein
MQERKKARWIAMEPRDRERETWRLPYVGAVQDGLFYHFGGMTHMRYSGEKFEILRDYGDMTIDEWDLAGGDNQWFRDFPAEPSDVSEFNEDTEAWVNPNGDLFLCACEEHESLAARLVYRFSVSGQKTGLNHDGDLLEGAGWFRVYYDRVYEQAFTQRQLDTLFDLLLSLDDREILPYLSKSIRRALDIDEKQTREEEEEEILDEAPPMIEETGEEKSAPRGRFVLTNQPYVEFTVRAYYTREDLGDGRSRGISCFKMLPTEVSSDDGKTDLGMISGGTGYLVCTDRQRQAFRGGGEFFARHEDIWYAFQRALDEKYGSIEEEK